MSSKTLSTCMSNKHTAMSYFVSKMIKALADMLPFSQQGVGFSLTCFKFSTNERVWANPHSRHIQFDIFKQLLHYLYSGRLSLPLIEAVAQSLYMAANKYHIIDDLKEECVGFLLGCIWMENAITLMIWAHTNSVDNLKEVALSFVVLHGKKICLCKEWEELTKNYPDLCVLTTRRIIWEKS